LPQPRLTFACELDASRLGALVADAAVIRDLQALEARVAMMISDLSSERADAVRHLNAAGVPVVAIPLLPYADGYYFTADNAERAAARYHEWKEWTAEHHLDWAGVGLDIEPDVRVYEAIAENPWRLLPILLRGLRNRERPQQAAHAYGALVARIRADGWIVENYQFPPLADERRVGSTLLQRLFGLVDVATDREVWMLYTSFMRSIGPGLLWSYAPEATVIAVGSTGGAPDIPGSPQVPTLNWQEFASDLQLAHQWCDDLYVHSLEGCVQQDFLGRLRYLQWGEAKMPGSAKAAAALRRVLRASLWLSASPGRALTAAAVVAFALTRLGSGRKVVPKVARYRRLAWGAHVQSQGRRHHERRHGCGVAIRQRGRRDIRRANRSRCGA
jgi:hypothetical protein